MKYKLLKHIHEITKNHNKTKSILIKELSKELELSLSYMTTFLGVLHNAEIFVVCDGIWSLNPEILKIIL